MGRFTTVSTIDADVPKDETAEYLSPACPGCKQHTLFVLDRWGYTAWLTGTPLHECFPGLSQDVRDQMLTGWHPYCWNQREGFPHDGTEPHRHDWQGASDG